MTDPRPGPDAPAGPQPQVPAIDLPQLIGMLPSAGEDDLVVMVCCDPVYAQNHFLPFVYSLDACAPGMRCHIHLVAPSLELLSSVDALDVDLLDTAVTGTSEIVALDGMTEMQRGVYYANIRFFRAHQIMEAQPCRLLILDVDSIVRGPLSEAVPAPGGHDVGLRIEDAMPEHMRVKAGAVLIEPTVRGRTFLATLGGNIAINLSQQHDRWYLDQILLNQIVERMSGEPEGLRVHRIGPELLDWEFGHGSALWTGKGARKDDDPAYVAARDAWLGHFGASCRDRLWQRAAAAAAAA